MTTIIWLVPVVIAQWIVIFYPVPGYWLLVLSAALLTNYAASWIMFGANCLFLPLLIRAEERELLVRYGTEYAAYMRRVPRFFPQLR